MRVKHQHVKKSTISRSHHLLLLEFLCSFSSLSVTWFTFLAFPSGMKHNIFSVCITVLNSDQTSLNWFVSLFLCLSVAKNAQTEDSQHHLFVCIFVADKGLHACFDVYARALFSNTLSSNNTLTVFLFAFVVWAIAYKTHICGHTFIMIGT